jgi:hypothetical protein
MLGACCMEYFYHTPNLTHNAGQAKNQPLAACYAHDPRKP